MLQRRKPNAMMSLFPVTERQRKIIHYFVRRWCYMREGDESEDGDDE
jgi:hypothetical protein